MIYAPSRHSERKASVEELECGVLYKADLLKTNNFVNGYNASKPLLKTGRLDAEQ